MPKRLRLTRRPNIAMSEDAYRRLRRFSAEAGLDDGEALTFLFENFDQILDDKPFEHRLRVFNSELEERKK